jgi:hypothetical protein
MSLKTCVVYSLTRNSMGCVKLNSYYGDDLNSRDSSLCAAFTNTDRNHFYFSYPDLVPNKSYHRYVCLWCNALCDQTFCNDICESTFDLNTALEFLEDNSDSKLTIPYRFTQFN